MVATRDLPRRAASTAVRLITGPSTAHIHLHLKARPTLTVVEVVVEAEDSVVVVEASLVVATAGTLRTLLIQ